MSNAKLFIVSAPSGCGKGTILSEFFEGKKVFNSVSCTTRGPRVGEIDGVHYHFIDDETFQKMIDENGFLEYAKFASNAYGTPSKPVLENLENGVDVILEIETQGAFQVKKVMPEAVMLFILPPSVRELKRRLLKRGTEKEDVIEQRLSKAVGEIEQSYKYEYVIMNDELDDAVNDFKTVFESVKNGDSNADKFNPSNENIKNMIDGVLKNA